MSLRITGEPVKRPSDPTLSDEVLRRARAGEEQALRQLYEGSRTRVMRLACSLLGDADEAEDVMQDVMVYALTHLDRYDERRAAFPTWLHMVTVSRCRDRARKQRTGLRRLADWLRAGGHSEASVPEAHLDRLDAASKVAKGLEALTPLQREALVLREVEGLSFEELSLVLGVPMRTAQARVTSAHAAMRRALGAAAGDDGGESSP